MVGYNPEQVREYSDGEIAVAAAGSGATTRFICQPLDVLKIRFQLQLEPISKRADQGKYRGMYHCTRTMIQEEGVVSLWKGHVPAQFLSVLYGLIQFSSFELLTKQAWQSLPQRFSEEWKPLLHFACGGLSGCAATFISTPFDVIRTRLVGQGEPKVYGGMIDAFRQMVTKEGPRALYKGLAPALIQIAPYSGIQFGVYTYVTVFWKAVHDVTYHPKSPIGVLESLISGMFAGLVAKTTIYPLDVIKKRLQVQGFEFARKHFGRVSRYAGLMNCITTMVKEEGFLAFYKGLSPSCAKAMMSTGCNFMLYEQTIQLLHRL